MQCKRLKGQNVGMMLCCKHMNIRCQGWAGRNIICIHYAHMGGWWKWSLDGVAPSRMLSVSTSVNLPLHHEVQKLFSGTGSPRWSLKKGRKTVVVWWSLCLYAYFVCIRV